MEFQRTLRVLFAARADLFIAQSSQRMLNELGRGGKENEILLIIAFLNHSCMKFTSRDLTLYLDKSLNFRRSQASLYLDYLSNIQHISSYSTINSHAQWDLEIDAHEIDIELITTLLSEDAMFKSVWVSQRGNHTLFNTEAILIDYNY